MINNNRRIGFKLAMSYLVDCIYSHVTRRQRSRINKNMSKKSNFDIFIDTNKEGLSKP
ncbi:MAG TPA: hypothetical protein VE619_07725 [Nitrososphaeraceae archaeon]|nr:hypothetical protein [Nitrososphaeraceae archaeon]